MPLVLTGGALVETPIPSGDQAARTGTIRSDGFAIRDVVDEVKQLKFDVSALATNTTVTIAASSSNTGTLTLPAITSGTLAVSGIPGGLQYATPINTDSVTIAAGNNTLVLEPAGTIAGATVVLPTAPANGTRVDMSTTQTITNLTLSGGGSDTIVNAVATLVANAITAYVYRASTTKWYRIG